MPARRELFPHVIEMNHQARRRLGCCVYLVHDQSQWMLIDIGYEDTVAEIVDMIRRMDFSLANCRYLVATHADVDHIQGLKKAKDLLPSAETVGHPETRRLLLEGDRVMTYAEISAQQISIDLPLITLDRTIDEGDVLKVGDKSLEVWHTPGHTHGQLSFRMDDCCFAVTIFTGTAVSGTSTRTTVRIFPHSSVRSNEFATATLSGSCRVTGQSSARTTPCWSQRSSG
jgi:glyoxylase-like metal-dependent hydrolase (beta-lactamase superfamily II)